MNCRILLCAALFGMFAFGGANPSPSQKKDDPPKKAAEGDDLAKLGKARRDAAEKVYNAWNQNATRNLNYERLYHLSIRWLNAELDLANGRVERIAAYRNHLDRVKEWEKRFKRLAETDNTGYLVFEAYLTEAEYFLAKERSAKR